MRAVQWTHHITSLAYIIFSWLLLATPREAFNDLVFNYSILFGCYLVLIHFSDISYKYLLNVVVISQVGALFLLPELSNDVYRFLWDGAITWMGENPFNSTPAELMESTQFSDSHYLKSLYWSMSDLSKENYTCYPTVNQFYFVAANSLTENNWFNIGVLKFLIAITQGLGIIYFVKLLGALNLSKNRIFILILNPLWLAETVGNLHFEGVMLSFLIMALYFLIKKQWLLGAIFLGIAIHIKLIPLVLLPFLFRYLGWKISAFIYAMTAVIVVILGLIYFDQQNIYHFFESLTLYFKAFEFNSFLYYHYLHYGYTELGYFPTHKYGLRLSRWCFLLILMLSVYGGFHDFKTMMKRMMFGLLIYLLFATTVHPWYVLTLLGISIFTRYSFGVIWSFLIILSYAAYGAYADETIRHFITLEYLLLFVAVGVEIVFSKPIIPALGFQDSLDSRSGTGS